MLNTPDATDPSHNGTEPIVLVEIEPTGIASNVTDSQKSSDENGTGTLPRKPDTNDPSHNDTRSTVVREDQEAAAAPNTDATAPFNTTMVLVAKVPVEVESVVMASAVTSPSDTHVDEANTDASLTDPQDNTEPVIGAVATMATSTILLHDDVTADPGTAAAANDSDAGLLKAVAEEDQVEAAKKVDSKNNSDEIKLSSSSHVTAENTTCTDNELASFDDAAVLNDVAVKDRKRAGGVQTYEDKLAACFGPFPTPFTAEKHDLYERWRYNAYPDYSVIDRRT